MTVLMATGVLYADHDTDATRHDAASTALEAVYDGEFGQPYVSDYIFDEAVTLTRKRRGSFSAAKGTADRLRGIEPYPQVFELRQISAAQFSDANAVFERYDDQELSFTDATTIAVVNRHDLDGVLSFDDDFDGLVTRFVPEDIG